MGEQKDDGIAQKRNGAVEISAALAKLEHDLMNLMRLTEQTAAEPARELFGEILRGIAGVAQFPVTKETPKRKSRPKSGAAKEEPEGIEG